MRPVFANSASVRAAERLILRGGRWQVLTLRVRYGFFIHPSAGPVLIDTGYGPHVTAGADRSPALRFYTAMLGPHLNGSQSPLALLARHGLSPDDVTTIIVTHFHADHVSELKAFPKARFILDLAALTSLEQMGTAKRLHHGVFMELLPEGIADRSVDVGALVRKPSPLGLPDGYDLFGDGSALAIPLPGHGHGHFGVCFPNQSPPLLYGVDTQWLTRAITEDRAPGYPAKLLFSDPAAAAKSNAVVGTFCAHGGQLVLCHDPALTPYDVPEIDGWSAR